MDVTALVERLDDRAALEHHLQSVYVEDALAADDAANIDISYYQTEDIAIDVRAIDPSQFTLDDYAVEQAGLGGEYTVRVHATFNTLVEADTSASGSSAPHPSDQPREAYAGCVVYTATAHVSAQATRLDGTVVVASTPAPS